MRLSLRSHHGAEVTVELEGHSAEDAVEPGEGAYFAVAPTRQVTWSSAQMARAQQCVGSCCAIA